MAIQCGHKKLQGRLQLFGRDFAQVSGSSTDGIPFIVKKCICEIERRALRTKVRVWMGFTFLYVNKAVCHRVK